MIQPGVLRRARRLGATLLSLCLALSACDGGAGVDSPDAADDTGGGDAVEDGAGDAVAEIAAVPSVSMRLVPFDFFSNAPLEGVEVCAEIVLPEGGPDCFTTTAEGVVFLVPKNGEQVVTLTRDDLYPTVFPAPRRDRGFAFTVPMFRASVVDAAAAAVGVTLDPSRGHVLTLVSERGTNQSEAVPGTAFTCAPEGEGPFYISDSNLPDPERTGTSSVGAAAFFNVPLGDAQVAVVNDERSCVLHGPGFEAAERDDVAVAPVRAGTLTHTNFRCPQ